MTTMRKAQLSFFLAVLILFSAAACGTQPVTVGDLPAYPGATPLEPGQNTVADSVVSAMQQSAEQQSLNAQFRLFSLPAGTTWDDVKNFYTTEMTGRGWKPESAMDVTGGAFQATGWSLGTGDSQQALVLGYVPDVGAQGAFATLAIFSK
jgi:hypothetical protein